MKYHAWVVVLIGLLVTAFLFSASVDSQAEEVLLEENFDGLTLGESVQEALARNRVWTNVPPTGWSIENDIPNNGMPEWEGWAFADPEWWTLMADDQNRSQFTRGDGKAMEVIAVADPDEWDDAGPAAPGPYNTYLSTPEIDISQVINANSIQLTFDSSWRPEDTQNANLTVSFDGGEPITILEMLSVGVTTNFIAPGEVWVDGDSLGDNLDLMIPDNEQLNETLTVNIPNPDDADTMVITWGMFDATNDWWWAVDNIRVTTTALSVAPVGKLTTIWAEVKRP